MGRNASQIKRRRRVRFAVIEGGYKVTSTGRVFNPNGEEVGWTDAVGYRRVKIGTKTHKVHRLVLQAFVGPCPDGQQVRHLDGDKENNNLRNLRYGTGAENTADKVRHGTMPQLNVTECPEGHEYTKENTYEYKGRRTCRECQRARSRAWKQKNAWPIH